MTVLDDRRPSDRVAELHQRVERCRERVVELTRRWAEVSEQTRNRAQPLHCNHMEEVQQLRTVLDDLAREVSGFQTALETRGVIDQAKGMIMLREHCDAGRAFEVLVRVSQTSHRKLHDVAAAVVESAVGSGHGQT